MNNRFLLGVLFVSALFASTPPTFPQEAGLNFISNLKGKVEIKRSTWKSYQKANFGDVLNANDRIRVLKGSLATVTCSNLTNWAVPAGKDSQVQEGCKGGGRTVLTRQDQRTSPTRDGNDPTLPYLITPRNSALLGRQPILQWNNINAAPYQVTVRGGEVNWSTSVNQSQVIFPGNQQPLQPGFRYRVTVVAQSGKRTIPDDPISFTFLSNAQVRQVQQDVQQIKQLSFDPAAQILAIALLYQSYDLRAEAIALLKDTSSKGIQTTVTTQLLGELYQQSGLPGLAKDQYMKALQLAQTENNLEAKAILQNHLGEVNESLDQLKEALRAFQDARLSYQALGDVVQVKTLKVRIDDLSKRVPRS